MTSVTCMFGGPLFDGKTWFEDGMIFFDTENILSIGSRKKDVKADVMVDVGGSLILPGLVDLHSDTVEKCIEMRPGVFFDPDFAIQNLDRRLAACGITTFCHALSFGQEEAGLRASEAALDLVKRIHDFAKSDKATIRHKVHGRYEVGTTEGIATLEGLIAGDLLDMVSVMDHTPGQGQFRTYEAYCDYYTRNHDITKEELSDVVARKARLRKAGWGGVRKMADAICKKKIPFMSHDDDTAEKIRVIAGLGVTASEFPVSMEAAKEARKKGLHVFMGAPNLFRGKSSSGQLAARETVAAGVCDGLISDYYPECLLQSPFVAKREISGLPKEDAFSLVTAGPGRFLDPEGHTGRLICGGDADIIVVRGQRLPVVQETWVGGRCVYRSNGRRVAFCEEAGYKTSFAMDAMQPVSG